MGKRVATIVRKPATPRGGSWHPRKTGLKPGEALERLRRHFKEARRALLAGMAMFALVFHRKTYRPIPKRSCRRIACRAAACC